MEGSMFCYQCQEASGNKGCTVSGRCGETTETANLQDRLVAELKAVALTLEGRTNVTREQLPTKSYANPIFLPSQGTDSQRYHNGITTEGEYRFG